MPLTNRKALRFTLAELNAIQEALDFRLAGEIDPEETGGVTEADYEHARALIGQMIVRREGRRKP